MSKVNYTSKQTNKLVEKEISFVIVRGGGGGEGGMDEGGQEIQTSSYKVNKYKGSSVQHGKYN